MSESLPDLPDDLKSLLDLSSLERAMREEGGSDRVEARLKQAIEDHPGHGVPLAAWAWYLASNEDFVGAVAWQTLAIVEGPDALRPMWRTQRAGYRFRAGDWQTGFREFQELIEADPANPVPRIARSYEMRSMGDHVSGELDEICAMHLLGQVTTDSLFVFFRQNGPYATPERLKASLFVLSDPVDSVARIHRGEMFMSMGAPLAAYYDLHLADVLQPRNLGLMARLEDIRTKGILAEPPLYEPAVPALPILPDYERILVAFAKHLEHVVQSQVRGTDFGWLERYVGRAATADVPDQRTIDRNFLATGFGIALAADCVAFAAAILIDACSQGAVEPLKEFQAGSPSAITIAGSAVMVLWALGVFIGSVIVSIGAVQRFFGCRLADMSAAILRRRWYFRPFWAYGFGIAFAAILFVSILMHGMLTMAGLGLLAFARALAAFSIVGFGSGPSI